MVAHVLEHLAASLLAFTALVGTFLHDLIVGVLLASIAAALAGLGAGGADEVRERPAPRRDRRRRRTVRRAVLARLQRVQVLLLAVGDQLRPVNAANIRRPP